MIDIFLTKLNSSIYYDVFYGLAILLIAGLVIATIFKHLGLPKLSAYVLSGIIIGPNGLKFISVETIESLKFVTHFGLGVIAFMIGMEFHRSSLKGIKKIMFITLFQACATLIIVAAGLYYLGLVKDIGIVVLLGVIAAATAPGPIILFIKRYNVKKSELKNILLPVVALDDAVVVIMFAFASAFFSKSQVNISQSLNSTLIHVGSSLTLGILLGLILAILQKFKEGKEEYLTYSVSAIAAAVALAHYYHASAIIILIVTGAVFTNFINKNSYDMQDSSLHNFTPPIFILFYSIAGASLPLSMLHNFIILIIFFCLLRIIGKTLGFYIGGKAMKVSDNVSKKLGLAALPQAGIAIGIATSLPLELREYIAPIVLGAVLFFQVIGPLCVRYAFKTTDASLHDSIVSVDKKEYSYSVGTTYSQSSPRNIFINAAKRVGKNSKKKKK